MPFVRASRLDQLPPYLFADIDARKRAAMAAGKDVIDFGVGDPDLPTPGFIVEAMRRAAGDACHHRYPLGTGLPEFREAAARWFDRRFGVALDPQREVLQLIGSKEGLGHLPVACLNPGDVALVPSPAYPVYRSASMFAGGRIHDLPLTPDNGWLPDLDSVPPAVARAAKLLFLNYPNNPTGATADLAFLERAVDFGRRHDVLIVQDAAYSEMSFEEPAPSILQVARSKDIAVEFHSLSKIFNMTGWRLGFAVGSADVLAALAKVKANMDSGQFGAVQMAGVAALDRADHAEVRALREVYRQRRDGLVAGLRQLGLAPCCPQATFYVWMPVPGGGDSVAFARRLLEEACITVVPGVGFGPEGEGYVRFALTVPAERIRQALQRLEAVCLPV